MKCKIFIGRWYEAQDAFNQWAKGKALTREVLIHTLHVTPMDGSIPAHIAIVVYHPEDPQYDKTEQQKTPNMTEEEEEYYRKQEGKEPQ
jgi:hypothetical protein